MDQEACLPKVVLDSEYHKFLGLKDKDGCGPPAHWSSGFIAPFGRNVDNICRNGRVGLHRLYSIQF